MEPSKREILENYRAAMIEKAAIEKQLAMLRIGGEPAGLRGLSYDRESRCTNEPVMAAVQALEGIEEKLMRQRDAIVLMADAFWKLVDEIGDRRERTLIVSYYANGESDRVIASAMGMDSYSVFRLRHRILEKYFPERNEC